jgi:hypothetical protein
MLPFNRTLSFIESITDLKPIGSDSNGVMSTKFTPRLGKLGITLSLAFISSVDSLIEAESLSMIKLRESSRLFLVVSQTDLRTGTS